MEDAAKRVPGRPALLLRAVRWLGGVLVLWLLLGLGSYVAVPWVVKRQLEAVGSEKLGRQVQVAAVTFKPWSLALGLEGLTVAASASAPASSQGVPGRAPGPQLSIRHIRVDVSLESLWRLAPVVDAITVEAPQLRLAHGRDGGYDIDDILARLAAAPAEPASDKPVRFALYNLLLAEGAVDFADETTARTHTLRELKVAVPFLSNLPAQRDVKVSPHLAFVLNGSRFDSAAEGTPFAQTRKTDATLKITGLDLKPYLAYWPEALPVKLQSAILDLDLRMGFEQAPESRVRLSGTADARQVSVTTPATAAATVRGAPDGVPGVQELLALDALKLTLDDVRPLERVVKLASLALQAPRVHLRRASDGRMVWPPTAASRPVEVTEKGGTGEKGVKEGAQLAPGGWQVELAHLVLNDGSLAWDDASTRPVASLALTGLRLDATGLAWPLAKPVPFQGAVALSGNGSASGQLSVSGLASLQAAQLTATVADLPLAAAASYLAPVLVPGLEGLLSAELALAWKAGIPVQGTATAPSDELDLSVNKLVLDKLALLQAGPAPGAKARDAGRVNDQGPGVRRDTLASVQQLVLTSARLQLHKQELQLASLLVKNPKAAVVRGADGHWMFEHWLPKPAVPAQPGLSDPSKPTVHQPGPPTPSPSPATRPWKLVLADVTLDGGAFSFADKAAPQPVALEITGLNLRLKNLVPDGDKPQPLSLSAKVAAGSLEPGLFTLQGSLTPQPLALQARIDAKHLPAHALAPYAASALNLDLLRADTSYLGQLQFHQTPAGPVVALKGDLGIEEFRANTTPLAGDAAADNLGMQLAEPLLNWKTLAVRGLDVALAPGVATRVAVRETVLSDFFARVIVRETGRINLQDLVRTTQTTPGGTATAAVPAAAASARTAQAAAATSAPSTAPASPAAPAAIVQIGPISLLNGKVDFADHFVKPNYSADLSELTGKLSGFSSETSAAGPQLADLELRGRAESTASLEITGKLNPLAQPLALDIKGKVRDLELPPLSPYAIKYAGHGIERGKLSVDVAYLVKPDGQLTAGNRLVLNQLSFGDRVESSSASLPVKLAVALLADRNGVIDLDLPISGSLNDPQFSLGPVIVKVILNVIGKALTAPFSLLAGALGGGGDELSSVSFAPGSARLEPPAKQALDKVAKALADRPSLQMTVVGTASLDAEREAFQRERLQALLRAEKRRVALQAGGPAGAPKDRKDAVGDADPPLPDDQAAPVSEADYPVLLKQVYQRAEIPRPRNALGMLKDIPVPEMAALLLANLPATPEAMRQLALQRGVAVRDYLVARQLPVARLFLGAAKTVAAQDRWTPRAELSLATP